jgi:hypothetical protein
VSRFNNREGTIDYAVGTLEPEPSDSGVLLTIFFRVKGKGESSIRFQFDQENNRNTLFVEEEGAIETEPDKTEIRVIPESSELLQIYPNPARTGCYIPFKIATDAYVSLTVYNILGQKVKRIDAGYKKAGFYTEKDKALFWNLRNDRGERVSKGLYFVRFTAGKFSATKPIAVRY